LLNELEYARLCNGRYVVLAFAAYGKPGTDLPVVTAWRKIISRIMPDFRFRNAFVMTALVQPVTSLPHRFAQLVALLLHHLAALRLKIVFSNLPEEVLMNKFLLAAIGVASMAASASAADMPVKYKAPPPVVAAVYNWSGFYIGAQGGGGWSHDNWHLIQNAVDFSFDGSGGLAGGYAGYNWQMSNFVLGVEVEGAWANIAYDNLSCTIAQAALCSSNINALGSVRGRAGVAMDRVLLYVGAGWAVDRFSTSRIFQPAGGGPLTTGVSDNNNGWVVSVGIEGALAANWVARLQYDHYDFGSKTYLVPALSNVSDTTLQTRVDTVRVGIAYKFGGPVVAKY
jgi:outer membrane immunogenic protein